MGTPNETKRSALNPVAKTIFGSIARHWLGAFLAIVGVKAGLSSDAAAAAVAQLTDEIVANAIGAFYAAVVPAAWSFLTRQALLLKARLALRMNRGSTEQQLRNVIAEAPRGARALAILTADPLKL